jgi:hypothetical protein
MEPREQVEVLRWLRDRPGASVVHDSDLMMQLGLSEAQAQNLLLTLQARGEIAFRNLDLQEGGHSLAGVRLRKPGLSRLRREERLARPPRASRLRRALHWFAGGRRD